MADADPTNYPPLAILYRDEELVAVNKPAGLLVHRSPIDRRETRFALQLLRDQLGCYVYPLHRLDKPTSGVLWFALSKAAAQHLQQEFAGRRVSKNYLAVVRGFCPAEGVIHHPLIEEDLPPGAATPPAQEALTHYRCHGHYQLQAAIETYPTSRYSLLQLQPQTGRRHQLRRHMKHISHPIIGDAKHGRGRHNRYFAEVLQCPRLLLHCAQMSLIHPMTGENITVTAPLDALFNQLLQRFAWENPITEVTAD